MSKYAIVYPLGSIRLEGEQRHLVPTGPEDRDLVLKVSSKGRQGRGLLASSESLNDCKGLHLEINRWPHGYWSTDRKLAKGLLLHLLSQILSPLSTWTLAH